MVLEIDLPKIMVPQELLINEDINKLDDKGKKDYLDIIRRLTAEKSTNESLNMLEVFTTKLALASGNYRLTDSALRWVKRDVKNLQPFLTGEVEKTDDDYWKIVKQYLPLWKKIFGKKKFVTSLNVVNDEPFNFEMKKTVVVGTFSSGKSTLINSLLSTPVLDAKNSVTTMNSMNIVLRPEDDGLIYKIQDREITPVVKMNTKEFGNADIAVGATHLLAGNVHTFVDTPGINSFEHPEHLEETVNVLTNDDYDNVLYVMNATQLLTNDDVQGIATVFKHVSPNKKIVIALNKLDKLDSVDDLSGMMRKVHQKIDEMRDVDVVPVSAKAFMLGSKQTLTDAEENEAFSMEMNLEDVGMKPEGGLATLSGMPDLYTKLV